MMTLEIPRFACPSCNRNIINRKINRCLYCGATLPSDLLFTKEEIAVLDEQEHRQRVRGGSRTDNGFDAGDALDIVSDLGDLF